MSHEPSAKRQRVDYGSGVAAHVAPAIDLERIEQLRTKILALSTTTIQAMAMAVVMREPSGFLAALVEMEHAQVQEQERARAAQPVNFSKYVDQADYVLNEQYEHLSGSKQYDAAGDAESEVGEMLDAIVKGTRDFSVYATKKSAVETMRSIFEIMLEAGGVIGKEVRKDCYDWDSRFLQVMGRFTEEELKRLATEDGGAWVEQLRALVGNANGYCILEKLQESLDDLQSYQVGHEDEDEDGDEDGEDAD